MTATVRLRVQMTLFEPDMRDGTQVFVNLLPSDAQDVARRNLPIIAGFDVPFRDFVVEPGRYTVELLVPSGRVLTDELEVSEGEAVEYQFDLQDSPHESHSWQYLAGNVEPSRRTTASSTARPSPTQSSRGSPSRLTRQRRGEISTQSREIQRRRLPSSSPRRRRGSLSGRRSIN
jgi:hypothetical protein